MNGNREFEVCNTCVGVWGRGVLELGVALTDASVVLVAVTCSEVGASVVASQPSF